MPDLVAIDLPGGPGFVAALRNTWERGHAVLPVDRRLSALALGQLFEALRPSAVIDGSGAHRLDGGVGVEAGDALVMATSGTTGSPKGVILTHQAVLASAAATTARLKVDPDAHRWLACLPLNHVGGMSVVTRAVLTDTALTVHDGFDLDRVLAAAGPEVLVSLVPTALRRTGAAAFRTVVLGGSAPPSGLPSNVVTTYGLTETGSGVVYDGVALDGVDLDVGPTGEISVRGPMLLRAYRGGAEGPLDSTGTRPVDADGWFATGDSGAISADGRLEIHGRLSDLIITGGENVWPTPVEVILQRHPAVDQVAVAGRPDPEWGERVVAWVVPVDPDRPPTLESLRELVSHSHAAFAAPKELVVVAELPRTAIGKVRRQALR